MFQNQLCRASIRKEGKRKGQGKERQVCRGYLNQAALGAAQVSNGIVALIAQHNQAGAAGSQLLDDALHLGMHPVTSGNDDDGHVLIHQSQGAVLHLAC